MSKGDGDRGFKARGQFSSSKAESDPSPTIVGAQPRKRRKTSVNVPVGMEKLLYLAATDETFRTELFRDREAAIEAWGVRLRDSELSMLRLVSDAQLQASIDRMDVSKKNVERRSFMRAVAVSTVALAAGKALGGCDGTDTEVEHRYGDAGIDFDYDYSLDAAPEAPATSPDLSVDAGIDVEYHDAAPDGAPADAGVEDANSDDTVDAGPEDVEPNH